MIIEKYQDAELNSNVLLKTNRALQGFGPAADLKLEGRTLVLFSGSWRFNLDADYIEYQYYNDLSVTFHKNTKFVNNLSMKLLSKILSRYDNLVLDNCVEFRYKTAQEINSLLKDYCSVKPSTCKLIAIVKLTTMCVNRLTTDIEMIKQQILAESFSNNNFLIIKT
jgi:hypothetical protein